MGPIKPWSRTTPGPIGLTWFLGYLLTKTGHRANSGRTNSRTAWALVTFSLVLGQAVGQRGNTLLKWLEEFQPK
jgi:hypothetical protein